MPVEENHKQDQEILVGYLKPLTGRDGMYPRMLYDNGHNNPVFLLDLTNPSSLPRLR